MAETRKVLIGQVLSDKMDKTVVVAVERRKRHRLYKKLVRKTKRFYVHDEEGVCRVGDTVRIVETRPLSLLKRWRVAEILKRQEVPEPILEVVEEILPEPVVQEQALGSEPSAEAGDEVNTGESGTPTKEESGSGENK